MPAGGNGASIPAAALDEIRCAGKKFAHIIRWDNGIHSKKSCRFRITPGGCVCVPMYSMDWMMLNWTIAASGNARTLIDKSLLQAQSCEYLQRKVALLPKVMNERQSWMVISFPYSAPVPKAPFEASGRKHSTAKSWTQVQTIKLFEEYESFQLALNWANHFPLCELRIVASCLGRPEEWLVESLMHASFTLTLPWGGPLGELSCPGVPRVVLKRENCAAAWWCLYIQPVAHAIPTRNFLMHIENFRKTCAIILYDFSVRHSVQTDGASGSIVTVLVTRSPVRTVYIRIVVCVFACVVEWFEEIFLLAKITFTLIHSHSHG